MFMTVCCKSILHINLSGLLTIRTLYQKLFCSLIYLLILTKVMSIFNVKLLLLLLLLQISLSLCTCYSLCLYISCVPTSIPSCFLNACHINFSIRQCLYYFTCSTYLSVSQHSRYGPEIPSLSAVHQPLGHH